MPKSRDTSKGFGLAIPKPEGGWATFYGRYRFNNPPPHTGPKLPETTYVERCVPVEHEKAIHELITKYLKDHNASEG